MILKNIIKSILLVTILLLLTQSLLISIATLSNLSLREQVTIQAVVLMLLAIIAIFLMTKSQIRLARYIYAAPLVFAAVMSVSLVNRTVESGLSIGRETIIQDFDVNHHRDSQFANGRVKAKRSLYNDQIIWDEYSIDGGGVMRVTYMDGNQPTAKKQHIKIAAASLDSGQLTTACEIDLKADETVGEITLFGPGNETYRIYYKEKDLGWPDSYDPTLGLTERAHAVCKEMIEVYLAYGKLAI